jgi:Fur family transcriptional regulator, ferric uptake regulator
MGLAGLRPTPQRLAVLKALHEHAARFLDVEALHHAALGADIAVPLATVYRTLVELERAGIAQSIKLGTPVLYRRVPDDDVAQPHLVCTACGLAEPLGNDALMSQLSEGAGRHGFQLHPRVALVGLCATCARPRRQATTL